MINITIDPFPFRFGAFVLSWHGLFLALGVLITYLLFLHIGHERGFTQYELAKLTLFMIIIGVIGARLVDIIGNWRICLSAPGRIVQIQEGGVSITGAVLGCYLVLSIYIRNQPLERARLADLVAILAPTGLFIGRTGCLIIGDVAGIPTHRSWGLVYWHSDSSIPKELIGIPTVPVPLMLQLLDVFLFFLGFWLTKRSKQAGLPLAAFLMVYGAGRFLINFWQLGTSVWFGLKDVQWTAVLIFALGAWKLWKIRNGTINKNVVMI